MRTLRPVISTRVSLCYTDQPRVALSQKHHLPDDILYTSPVEHTRFVERGIWCDQPVVASATNPTLFTFNYLDIDSLYFTSSGGQPAFFNSGGGKWFAMDNFTPSSSFPSLPPSCWPHSVPYRSPRSSDASARNAVPWISLLKGECRRAPTPNRRPMTALVMGAGRD